MAKVPATRKFIPLEAVKNNDNGSEKNNNSDLIVEQASSLKALAIVTDQAATSARANLQASRDSIAREPATAQADARSTPVAFSTSDLQLNQQIAVRQISDQISRTDLPGIPVGDVQQRLESTANGVLKESLKSSLTNRDQSSLKRANSCVPEVDHIAVEIDKNKGTVDCFFSRITFSLPLKEMEDGKVKAVRIFRAVNDEPQFMKNRPPLSLYAMELLSTARRSNRSKTHDASSRIEQRLNESGIDTALARMNPIDPIRNVRLSVESNFGKERIVSTAVRPLTDDRAESLLNSFIVPDAFANLDQSVVKDLKTLRNIQIQNPSLKTAFKSESVVVGKNTVGAVDKIGDQQSKTFLETVSVSSNLVVGKNNGPQFREIAIMSPEKLSGRIVGDLVEYSVDDDSISYGKTYSYYLLTVDDNMVESARSRIVDVDVDGLRVPECPRRVNVSVTNNVSMAMSVDDKLVEKFEVYRKEADPGLAKAEVRNVSMLVGPTGATLEKVARFRLSNSFIQLGESIVNSMGSSTFFDRQTIPGRKYVYRIYSVDIFGNKSECPREVEVFVPDQARQNELRKPSLTVEVDAKTNKIRVMLSSDDERIKSLFLERRDLTIHQKSFTVPSVPTRLTSGHVVAGRTASRFDGPKLNDKEFVSQWNGHFANNGEEIEFIDNTTQSEHTYQYRIHGVDRFGNKSSFEVSRPIFVVNRAFIDAPVGLSSSLRVDSTTGQPISIELSWQNANVDVSAEDVMGSQTNRADTAVRTLYQVERRRIGEDRWLEFPLTEKTTFVDHIRTKSEAPNFRPEYAIQNEEYIYRVEAIQSGGFISNFSRPIEVFAGHPVQAPANFRIQPADTKIRPYYVVLSWDTPDDSGVVDRWEIERAEVNNFAASRLNLRSVNDFQSLEFKSFRTVFKESSRSKSVSFDDRLFKPIVGLPAGSSTSGKEIKLDIASERVQLRPALRVSDHSFMDSSVKFGNTYVYRIRAISPNGEESAWSLRAVRVADEIFDRKLSALLSDTEKNILVSELKPVVIKSEELTSKLELQNTTFALQPTFVKATAQKTITSKPTKHEISAGQGSKKKLNVDLRKR